MSISPNVPSPQESYHYENMGTPRWIAVLFGVLIVAVAALGYSGHSAQVSAPDRPRQGAGSEQAAQRAARSGQCAPRRSERQH